MAASSTRPSSPFGIIAQLEGWYSFCCPTEYSGLRSPRNCRLWLIPKAAVHKSAACRGGAAGAWPPRPNSFVIDVCKRTKMAPLQNLQEGRSEVSISWLEMTTQLLPGDTPILNMRSIILVLQKAIQVYYFVFYKLLDIFAHRPRKWKKRLNGWWGPSETLWSQFKFRDIWTLTSFSRSRSQAPFWHYWTSVVLNLGQQLTLNFGNCQPLCHHNIAPFKL